MKILIVIVLNCFSILGYYLMLEHRNDRLREGLDRLEQAIVRQDPVSRRNNLYRAQKALINKKLVLTRPLENTRGQTLRLIYNLINEMPKSLSLSQIRFENNTIFLDGISSSLVERNSWIENNQLKLISSSQYRFKASRKI